MSEFAPRPIHTVVIGGGQAGLTVGHHLAERGVPFVILDAGERVGDAWRHRWDSLRLFTPAQFCGLDGLPFPAPAKHYPTKDEMADYLEQYAEHFDLPVHLGARVDRLSRADGRFMVATGDTVLSAENVVVAIGTDQRGRAPSFASKLDHRIRQMHSSEYRRPDQLAGGDVLVVGAGNSGVEIALDLARRGDRRVVLSGRYPAVIPFDIDGFLGRRLLVRFVLRFVFHRVLTVATPIGRRARPKLLAHGKALVRSKPSDVAAAGIEHVAPTSGVRGGMPVVDDRTIDVTDVIWATGFEPGFDWIDIEDAWGDGTDRAAADEPLHRRGVVEGVPGLYLVGLDFLFSASSGQIHGVGRDAARIATMVAARTDHPPFCHRETSPERHAAVAEGGALARQRASM